MLDFSHNNLFEFSFQDKEKFIRTRNTEVGMIVDVVLSLERTGSIERH